ncbi:HNH endonuclease signature motif containing protein [[Limnothrix rosea] IAM M-220]|uniref:HNH endonuclease signature motif containing protein n=1 Tax=[Limnothrix rosea] IAM M-220 TaxID=454133 RepID=UPI0009696FA4|nr:HNH endonuclease signature motif containing protein [[Limnothrix rosea] IAM M-220]OKH18441.1 HNH endonuclease [[Limnothrix rosea] IAM M-220]
MSDKSQQGSEHLGQELQGLFRLADKIGKKRYHRLTAEDFEKYRAYDYWRYEDGDYELGTTQKSKQWVWENSDKYCPICDDFFSKRGGKTIDHKLPRAQYPWWSMDFRNFWIICQKCNKKKGEMHWYEYESYILKHYPDRYLDIKFARPIALLQELLN